MAVIDIFQSASPLPSSWPRQAAKRKNCKVMVGDSAHPNSEIDVFDEHFRARK